MSTSALTKTGYAPVNGLEMYYEIHGSGGTPLVLLHGSFMTIDLNWGELLPILAENRQVIAVEMQGHGHTADIDRDPTFEHFAGDVAALLDHLGIDRADVLGYSLGGAIAVHVAVRHPDTVRKVVVLSSAFRPDGWLPEVLAGIEALTPDVLEATPLGDAYRRVAPNPDGFAALVERIKRVDTATPGPTDDEVRGIAAPVMILNGDADGIRLEHTVAMFRLLGGGVFGDYAGVSASRLAILPGATHVGLMMMTDAVARLIVPFLDEPVATAA
jgi:pimeloyl-ACP methyl ester carboxylesterase